MSFVDKKDLLSYLTGTSETSVHITDPNIAENQPKKNLEPDFSDEERETKRIKASLSMEAVERDKLLIQDIVSKERTIHDHKTIMCVKNSKVY